MNPLQQLAALIIVGTTVLNADSLLAANTPQTYIFSTVAGTPPVSGSYNGTNASFNNPYGAAVDLAGNSYVADTLNSIIRKITTNGVVSTVAGKARVSGSKNATGTNAIFNFPQGIAVDGSGILYVADTRNDTIRKITTNGSVSTLAGSAGASGTNDGTNTAARFNLPGGVVADGSGNLYIADSGNNAIREITPTVLTNHITNWVVVTIAGTAGVPGSTDGPGSNALFFNPQGISLDGGTNLYVADSGNSTLRELTPSFTNTTTNVVTNVVTNGMTNTVTNTFNITLTNWTVRTIAGVAGATGSSNGIGTSALFNMPQGIASDFYGNLYVADTFNTVLRMVTTNFVVTTLAGTVGNFGSVNGTGANASFNAPRGIAVDASGNVYVADTLNSIIRKVDTNQSVTTIAGLAGSTGSQDGTIVSPTYFQPLGVAHDKSGNTYVVDSGNDMIRKIASNGLVATVAGSVGMPGNADGYGVSAKFNNPQGIVIDSSTNLYVADTGNNTVRKIRPLISFAITNGVTNTITNWLVSTLAGSARGTNNGAGATARFNGPEGVTVDGSGNLYVTDSGNSTIRMVTAGGIVTTMAGAAGTPGSSNGIGTNALFNKPEGITVDGATNLYVVDTGNNIIRVIAPGGVVTTLAGTAGIVGSADGTGTNASFRGPQGIVIGGTNLFVTDSGNSTLRQIAAGGVVTTVAGTAGNVGSSNGVGTNASFGSPAGITVDGATNLYLSDSEYNSIREIGAGFVVSTLSGGGATFGSSNGIGTNARFYQPLGVAVDGTGTAYMADSGNNTIRKITAAGVVTTIAGTAGSTGSSNGLGTNALFNQPIGITVDVTGNLYIADRGNDIIRKIDTSSNVTTVAGVALTPGTNNGTGTNARFDQPEGITVDANDNLFVADSGNNTIRMISTNLVVTTVAGSAGTPGSSNGTGINALFNAPEGITVDTNDNLFVADSGNNTIRMITSGGVVTTVAGTPGVTGSADGTGPNASFQEPMGISVDTNGNLFVADTGNNILRQIDTNAVVTTLGGAAGIAGSADGTNSNARFFHPSGIAEYGIGKLYIADSDNDTLRRGVLVLNPTKTQRISFTALPRQVFGVGMTNGILKVIPLVAMTTSGLPVTFTCADTSVATVSGTNLTIAGGGYATVVASQPGNATYLAAPDVRQVLIVSKGTQIITMAPISTTNLTYGDTNLLLVATNSSGVPVTFTSSNTNLVVLSNSVSTTTNTNGISVTTGSALVNSAGSNNSTITATAGNASYNTTSVKQVVLMTVAKENQVLSFISPTNNASSPFTNGGLVSLVATASSGLKVTNFVSGNPNVLTISGTNGIMIGTGTTTITANQAGNGNYNPAISITNTFSVAQGPQIISFVLPTNNAKLIYTNGGSFSLQATANSGLPVTNFVSGNTNVLTISGTNATVVGTGTTTITANQAGNSNYLAGSGTNFVQVARLQTITFISPANNATNSFTNGGSFPLTATASSGLPVTNFISGNTNVLTISGTNANYVGAGTTTITATQAGDITNYFAATPVTNRVIVSKGAQVISFTSPSNNANVPYTNGGTIALTAVTSSGLPVTFSLGTNNSNVITISNSIATMIGTGTATIIATQAGGANYLAATPVTNTLIVTQGTQTILFTSPTNNTSVTFTNGGTIPLTASADSGIPVTFSTTNANVVSINGSVATVIGAGTATITASVTGNANYLAATPVTNALIVTPANQTISFISPTNSTSLTYTNGGTIPLTATADSGLGVTFVSGNTNILTITTTTNGTNANMIGAGTTTITAIQTGNTNYNAAIPVTNSVILTKANQMISFASPTNNTSTNFSNGGVIHLAATADSGLGVTFSTTNASVLFISGTNATMIGAGTATITATQLGNANYNAATPVSNSVFVTQGSQTISFNSPTNNTSVQFTNGGIIHLAATASSGLPVTNFISGNTNVLTISGTNATMIGIGTATITANQAGNANFTAATPVTNTVFVTQVAQTISFTSPANNTTNSFTNGGSFPLTATASSGLPVTNFVSGNTNVLTISGTNANYVGVGTTTITANQAGNSNYFAATPVTNTVVVVKGAQTISFTSPTNFTTNTFTNGAIIPLVATSSSGLGVNFISGNTSVLTISGTNATVVGAGTANITALQLGNANYNAAPSVVNSVTVVPNQTISFTSPTNNTTVQFTNGGTIPLTATASSGLAVSFASGNTNILTITNGTNANMIGAGTTTITASQAGNTNFSAATSIVNTLIVSKGAQVISFTSPTNNTSLSFVTNSTVPLVATANSGLAVSFASGNTNFITISGSTATMKGTGTTTITASQIGNTNYNAATTVTNTVGFH